MPVPRSVEDPNIVTERLAVAQTKSWCRKYPGLCVREAGIETVFLLGAYLLLLLVSSGFTLSAMPAFSSVAQFVVLFAVLSVGARMVSDDLGNKMSIAAVSGVGAKVVSSIVPKFSAW